MRLLLGFAVCVGLVSLVRSDLNISMSHTHSWNGLIDFILQPLTGLHKNNPSTENPTTQNLPKNNPSEEKSPEEHRIVKSHFDSSSILFPSSQMSSNVLVKLYEAINSQKPDEDTIIKIISAHTHQEIIELQASYQELYKLDLLKSLRSILTGELEKAVISWMIPRNYYYAREIHSALFGIGADERALIDIFGTSNNSIINQIRMGYSEIFFRSIDRDMTFTLEFFRRLLYSSEKLQSHIFKFDNVVAIVEDELSFLDFLVNYPSDVFQFAMEYYKQSGKYLENTIIEKYSGDLKRTFLSIVYYAKGENNFFARRLHECLEGDIVDYNSLIRLAIMDKRVSYDEICDIYKRQYKRELHDVMSRKIRSERFRKFIEALFKRKQEPPVNGPLMN
ncbi:annexin B9-like [Chelonus insularis]|uniref:annexin B9-like n=1 Tax=Chelonus insularis TaxID=460826 RepID=UPI00158BE2CE|nr:annexin B9-like [Chelonus insularis]